MLDLNKLSTHGQALKDFFDSESVGQPRATMDFVYLWETVCAGYRQKERILHCSMLTGPNGVGKTFQIKLLAEFVTGRRDGLTFVHGESYTEHHQLATLLGSPPGYVGFSPPPPPEDDDDKIDPTLQGGQKKKKKIAKDQFDPSLPILAQHNIDRFVNRENEKVSTLRKSIAWTENELREVEKKILVCTLANVNRRPQPPGLSTLRLARDHEQLLQSLKILNEQLTQELAKSDKGIIVVPSILAIDEVDKTHRTVVQALLNAISSGKWALANGMVTDLTNTILLMTSNAGSVEIRNFLAGKGAIGFGSSDKDSVVRDENVYLIAKNALARHFSPEFADRLDSFVVYRPLTIDNIRAIYDINLANIRKDFWDKDGVSVDIAPEVKDFIVAKATESEDDQTKAVGIGSRSKGKFMGSARPLSLKMNKYLQAPMARLKNLGVFQGGAKIVVNLNETKNGKKFVQFFKESSDQP